MLKVKDSIEFNALDIDYTNVTKFIDGNIVLDLKLTTESDMKDFEEIVRKINGYKNYEIKVKINFIEKVEE